MNVMITDRAPIQKDSIFSPVEPQPLVMVVGDEPAWARSIEAICDFLDIGVEHVSSGLDVTYLMREFRPMAVITQVDLAGQDGFHVMQAVAAHDRRLPVMIVTGQDPAMMGAVDAMQEVTGLTTVRLETALPPMGEMVDFLFRAGRQAGIGRMMPISAR